MPPAQVSLVARDGVQATGRRATAPGVSQAPTVPGTVIDEETVRRFLPPFRVILHNDDHNSMDHVVRSLLSAVPSLTLEDAAVIMLTAHNDGQATVIECPKETAEHYRDRLESFGLTATMEPA